MRPVLLLIVSILFNIIMGCSNNRTEVCGTAVAERSCDGTVTIRKPTSSEIRALDDFDTNLKKLSRKYPGPQIPKDATLYKVTSVDGSGTIFLADGKKLQMEGLECLSQGAIYLQRFLTGESDRIAYIVSYSDGKNPIRAYI